MSDTTVNLLWMIVPTAALMVFVVLLNWYDKRTERKDKAGSGGKLLTALNTPYYDIVFELDRIVDLARKVAEVDVQNKEFQTLTPGQQRALVARQEALVLRSLADDMKRYVQEARS